MSGCLRHLGLADFSIIKGLSTSPAIFPDNKYFSHFTSVHFLTKGYDGRAEIFRQTEYTLRIKI